MLNKNFINNRALKTLTVKVFNLELVAHNEHNPFYKCNIRSNRDIDLESDILINLNI